MGCLKDRALRQDEHIDFLVVRRAKKKRVSDIFALAAGASAIFILEEKVELGRGVLTREDFLLLLLRYMGVLPSSKSLFGEKPPSKNANLHTV